MYSRYILNRSQRLITESAPGYFLILTTHDFPLPWITISFRFTVLRETEAVFFHPHTLFPDYDNTDNTGNKLSPHDIDFTCW